ncbi:hypothetical protein CSUI_009550 [Cystoisospora suis]|uniref:Uncharacterized protein n=1 Tax=Cystoisospora suis TaxID=483139 RepID=A0A2C6KJR5_9APIC|nr:hypothetical protein CSUI_009550 [Cystoisospora suis]
MITIDVGVLRLFHQDRLIYGKPSFVICMVSGLCMRSSTLVILSYEPAIFFYPSCERDTGCKEKRKTDGLVFFLGNIERKKMKYFSVWSLSHQTN